MGYHSTWGISTAIALFVAAICLIVATAGTQSGWFVAEIPITPGMKAVSFARLADHAERDGLKVAIEFGTVGFTIMDSYTSYDDLLNQSSNDPSVASLKSGGAAALSFSILGWIIALAGIVVVILSLRDIHHLNVFFLHGAVALIFVLSFLAWTVFLGVAKHQWSSQVGNDYPLNPSWAWAFAFIGFIASLASIGTAFMLHRNSHHDNDHHHHQEGFERV